MPDNTENKPLSEVGSDVVTGVVNSTQPAAPTGPVKRSMIFNPKAGKVVDVLPPRTMKYSEWIVLYGGQQALTNVEVALAAEKRAQRQIDKYKIYSWGDPYKNQDTED